MEDSQITEWKQMTAKQKFKHLIKNISVEPILCCYIISSAIVTLTTQNLFLSKACKVNLYYNESICDAIATKTNTTAFIDQETETQKIVTGMNHWQQLIKSPIPLILVLFLGSFSDRSGRRKPFILLPIVGELIASVGLILCVYFFYEWKVEVAGFIQVFFPAITGGSSTMFMAVFSYMGDITSLEMRTVRLGIINVFVNIVSPLATGLSGALYEITGFYGMLSTVSIVHVIGLVYGIFLLKEAQPPNKLENNLCQEFCNPQHLIETYKVATKKREGDLRLRVVLILLLTVTLFGPIYGEASVGYYFVIFRFQWTPLQFSAYSTYSTIVTLIGTAVAMGLFTHAMKMDDALLGLLACSSKVVASFLYAFAATPLTFYVATIVEVFGGAAIIAMRSIASKLVPSEELGKLNSLFGVCDAIVQIAYVNLYTHVYTSTLTYLPGAFFLLSSAFTIPSILIFLYLYILQKRNPVGVTSPVRPTDQNGVDQGVENHTFESNEGIATDCTKL